MKIKSGKWFTQVGLKNQGLKASKEQNLSPIIGFSRWEGSMDPFQKFIRYYNCKAKWKMNVN